MISMSATLGLSLLVTMAPSAGTAQAAPAAKPAVQLPSAQKPVAQAPAAPAAAAPAQAPAAPAQAAGEAAPNAAAPAAPDLHAVEAGILAQTNAQRARYGLRPLVLDLRLLFSARRHAQWMSRNHTMQHTSAQWPKTSPWARTRPRRP